MPEPPGDERQVGAGLPERAQVVVLEGVGDGVAAALRPQSGERVAHRTGPAAIASQRTRPTLAGVWRASSRTRLLSRIGVSGWSRMWVSESSASPTNRCPR